MIANSKKNIFCLFPKLSLTISIKVNNIKLTIKKTLLLIRQESFLSLVYKIKDKINRSLVRSIFTLLYAPKKVAGDFETNNIGVSEIFPIENNKNYSYKVYEIPQGHLFTDGNTYEAISRKRFLIPGASSQWKHDVMLPPSQNPALILGTPKPIVQYQGNLLSLITRSGRQNYYHWLYDILPRIHLCECAVDLDKIDHILVNEFFRHFQLETLDCLNISREKIISSYDVQHLKAENIIVTEHPNPNWTCPPQWIVNWLREQFLPKVQENSKLDLNTRIYIERGDSNQKRHLLNEEEVVSFLQQEGFTSYTLSQLSVLEQICLFSNAEIIVGVHGAGFANLAFSNKGTKIVEMFSEVYNPKLYELISSYNSLNYISIISNDVEQNEIPSRANFNISLEKLRQHL
ncbi:MAG: DUF563 domain-containing protein [Xenococcus sp. (in: cyanobacteria)]